MGRNSTDSEEEYSHRNRRSRSGSNSRSRVKKSKHSKHSRHSPRHESHSAQSSRSSSRTADRDDRHSRSGSRSHHSHSNRHHRDGSHRNSSRSIKKYKHRSSRSSSRHRSKSITRRKSTSRNSSKSKSTNRHRSRSRNMDRDRRSYSRESCGSSRHKSNGSAKPTHDPLAASKLAEQKLQMALKAAAAADETLKAQGVLTTSLSVTEQRQRAAAIDSIDKDDFVQNVFRSNRSEIPLPTGSSVDASHAGAIFSSTKSSMSNTELHVKNEVSLAHIADKDTIMHPNLYIGAEEKMENWKRKLILWRRQKLLETSGVRPWAV